GLFLIDATDISPGNEVASILSHIGNGNRKTAGQVTIEAQRNLVGVWRSHVRVDSDVGFRIDNRKDCGILTSRRVESSRNGWSLTRVNRHEFSTQNALVKAAITGSHHRFAISRQLDGDAQSRRYNIPLKQRSQTVDDRPRSVATVISCRKIRTDR